MSTHKADRLWRTQRIDGAVIDFIKTYTKRCFLLFTLGCFLALLPAWGICGDVSFSGFVELENLLQVGGPDHQPFDDADKKNELRTQCQFRYETDSFSFFMAPNLYLLSSALINDGNEESYFYKREDTVGRNLKLSGESYELALNECYIQYSWEKVRLRLGNQIYGWGTTDVYNPTSYFNPNDMREALFKDEDEGKEGVFSLSSMIFLDNMTIEMVAVPFHTPGLLPENGSFWEFSLDNYSLPVVFDDPEEKDISVSNTAVGMRLSSTLMNTDFSFSLFNGPDKDFLFFPARTLIEPDQPVTVLVEPRNYSVTCFGMDFSKAFDDIVVQGEVVYSPNKAVRSEEEVPDEPSFTLQHEVLKVPYISYAVGFNYFIPLWKIFEDHEGDTVFTMEWFQNTFLEDEVSPPILTNFLICSFRDSYFESHFGVSLTAIMDTKQQGYVFWPKLTYDFLNGLTTSLTYVNMQGDSDERNVNESLFYYFRDNDSLVWSIRYTF